MGWAYFSATSILMKRLYQLYIVLSIDWLIISFFLAPKSPILATF
jgi:hypothetical protein